MSEDYTILDGEGIQILMNSIVEYQNNETPTKLRSSNFLYTFIQAYQSVYNVKDDESQDSSFINAAFVTLLTSIYYTIRHCLIIFDGNTSKTPFVKFNSVNIGWLQNTPGLRGALEHMQFLLCFVLFKIRAGVIISQKYDILNHIPNDCMSIIQMLGDIPSVVIPESANEVPIIANINMSKESKELIKNDSHLLLFFRTISNQYISLVNSAQEIRNLLDRIFLVSHKDQKHDNTKPINDSELIALFEKKEKDTKVASTSNKTKKKKHKKQSYVKKELSSSSSSPPSKEKEDLSLQIQNANAFELNADPFVEITTDKERKYIFTDSDYQTILTNALAIVYPFRILFPKIFVKCRFSQTGHYLNIFSKKPNGMIDGKNASAHISFHPINDLYHFKITAFRMFNLHVPPAGKDYTISFKMHRSIDTNQLSATIQPFVNNVDTEVECPLPVIDLLQRTLDLMIELLNRNRLGGNKTKRMKGKRVQNVKRNNTLRQRNK